MREPLLSLMGPTGAGKSELGLEAAGEEGWEIVSVDSRQVFRRLDIGTAKPSAEERARVPHHLIDVAEPDEPYDGHRYAREAAAALREIESRGRRPLVVGGTGLYWQALVSGGFDGPAGDAALRREILREVDEHGPGWLHAELTRVDRVSAATLHPHDTFRLVRALEITRLAGKPASEVRPGLSRGRAVIPVRLVILTRPREELYRRIARRWEEMVKRGIRGEVETLLKDGYSPELPSLRSVGYREVVAHLEGRLGWAAACEEAVRNTRRYAKRQLTWFRHEPGARWLEAGRESRAALRERVRSSLLSRDDGS